MKKQGDPDPDSNLDQPFRSNQPRLSYAWLFYLGFGLLLVAGYYLLPLPETVQVLILVVLGLSPAVFVVGIKVYRPAHPVTWYLLLAGLSAFAAGDGLWEYEAQILGTDPISSVSSAFYLGGYASIFVALLILTRRRNPDGDKASLLDAAIVATGTGMLSWTFLAAPYLADSTLPTLERSLTVIYPLVDILLLAALVRLFLAPGLRVPAYWLLCLGLGALLASDTLYSAARLLESYEAGTASDVGWSLFYVLWGTAALHPSMRLLTRSAPRRRRVGSSQKRLVLLSAVSLLAPAVLAVQAARGAPTYIPVLVAGSVLLFSLALARMEGILRVLSSTLKKQERAEAESRASERRFRQLFEQSVDALVIFDTDGNIRDCNQETCYTLGYSREEMLRLKVGDISGGEGLLSGAERRGQQREAGDTLWQQYTAGHRTASTVHEGFHRRKDGSTYPIEVLIGGVEYGGERLLMASVRDVTERKRLEERLRHQASHDHLTNLPNRKLFEQRLERASDRARRDGLTLAVLYLDLDNFKEINDSLGHEIGDLLLVEVSRRLEECLRPTDTVARLGGDEFCILLEDLSYAGEAAEVSHRVAQILTPPVRVAGKEIRTTASIGVAVGVPGDWEPVSLLREADAAMYRTKRAPRFTTKGRSGAEEVHDRLATDGGEGHEDQRPRNGFVSGIEVTTNSEEYPADGEEQHSQRNGS